MKQLALALGARPAPTLENFVPGRNAAALAAVRVLLADMAGQVYLWGAPGSGRTHILEAALAAARARGIACARIAAPHPDWDAAHGKHIATVDDVERLAASDQVRLFDLLNELRLAGGALLAAGAAAPAGLALREDLRTRLAAGLVFQLHALDDAEKAAALAAHAAARGLRLGDGVLAYLLTHLRRDMATQIAVLDALDRCSLEQKRPVTLPLVREALAELAREER
ncbi:MAG: DnaA regulatory inactivator Hda [Burkholderiales bacterium]|nr:DnaA regulatory inactivator Hda [Burkholderiales bacterium]